MSISSLNYLLIYKDDQNKYVEEAVNVIPEEEYLLKSNFRKNKTPFEGFALINDWDGNFKKGYYYEKGEVKGKVVDIKKLRLVLCGPEVNYYSCPSENLSSSGEVINFDGCIYLYSNQVRIDLNGGGDGYGGSDAYGNVVVAPNENAPKPTFPSESQLKAKLCVSTNSDFHQIKSQMINDWRSQLNNAGIYDQNPDIGYNILNNHVMFRGVSPDTRNKFYEANIDFSAYDNCD